MPPRCHAGIVTTTTDDLGRVIGSILQTTGDFALMESYSYDSIGNITRVTENGVLMLSYQYDGQGQLVREDNAYASAIYEFTYIYLFSCKGGAGSEGNNVAWMFAKLSSVGVQAYTGSVSYSKVFGKYFARKALDNGKIKLFYYQKRYIFWGKLVAKSSSTSQW
ncbi:MAG: RHS repeat protein [Clostridia bacterium]|nr:RHS repeat protein [Clostridia bacterium]